MMKELENSKILYTLGFRILIETKRSVRDKKECEGTIGFLDFKGIIVFEILLEI